MKKPTRLPDIELIEFNFTYDPIKGILYTKHGNPIGANDRDGPCLKVRIGRKTTTVARVCWLLYYRKDPIGKVIRHINGDPFDNRIKNLRAVKL